jgi:hypothetical protein
MQRFFLPVAITMWCAALRRAGYATAFSSSRVFSKRTISPLATTSSTRMSMSTAINATPSSSVGTDIIPRVKAADAKGPSDGPVLVKGWVRTVRKQKTLAFVEVNDGSNLGGIQCVLSFDVIDDDTLEGKNFSRSRSRVDMKHAV